MLFRKDISMKTKYVLQNITYDIAAKVVRGHFKRSSRNDESSDVIGNESNRPLTSPHADLTCLHDDGRTISRGCPKVSLGLNLQAPACRGTKKYFAICSTKAGILGKSSALPSSRNVLSAQPTKSGKCLLATVSSEPV